MVVEGVVHGGVDGVFAGRFDEPAGGRAEAAAQDQAGRFPAGHPITPGHDERPAWTDPGGALGSSAGSCRDTPSGCKHATRYEAGG